MAVESRVGRTLWMVVFVTKQFSNDFHPHKENFSINERLIKYRIVEESVEIEKIRSGGVPRGVVAAINSNSSASYTRSTENLLY